MTMMDYSSKYRAAEEEIATYIDNILTEGGHMLWQKYLQRKAFPFAAQTATDALTGQLRMCFVAHDPGEEDKEEDWILEEEPEPGEVDNWARMHLAVRRPHRREPPADESADQGRRGDARRGRTPSGRSRVSDARMRARMQKGGDKPESRSYGIQDPILGVVDDEEEKLREAKAQEEARKRDRENKVRQAEKQKEEEARRVQALHEEMSRKQHTFDSEGNIIWVEEIKMEKLPKVQELFPYGIKKDPRSRDRLEETLTGKAAASPTAKKKVERTNARRKARFDRSSKAKEAEDDFPDGFSKLQHGQPPILETMVVKPGVVLDSGGKQKAGPAINNAGGGMSRKEYVAWTEKEGAFEAQFNQGAGEDDAKGESGARDSPGGKPGAGGKPGRPPGTAPAALEGGSDSARAAGGGASGALGASGGAAGAQGSAGLGETLPPIGSGTPAARGGLGGTSSRPSTSGGKPGSSQGRRKDNGEAQKAPSAPPMHVRQKKMESVGHLGRPPRLHVAPLGGPYGFSAAQPPLGATMGHGLLRSGSAKEAFFFPSSSPEMPELSSMLRSQSEAHLPREKSYLSAPSSKDAISAMSRDGVANEHDAHRKKDEDFTRKHGQIQPERRSPAYRGMRKELFPHAGDTGLSQYGAVYT